MNNKFWLFAACLAIGLPGPLSGADDAAEAGIRRLNDDSIRAFLTCDVARYRALLADDFRGVLADGRVIDKAEFLRQAAQPPGVVNFRQGEVNVRMYGDTALVTARIAYGRTDGTQVQTRFVDVYLRRDGRWQVVSAQFTRVAER